MNNFEPPNLWKRHRVFLGICAGRTNKEILDFLSISSRIVEKDQKGTRRFRIPLWGDIREENAEVQIIDNEPSKSMCVIERENGVDEKFIRLVVHEDIWYVSYKTRKEHFMSKAMQEKQLKHAKKQVNKLKHPLEPDMLQWENFCQDQMINWCLTLYRTSTGLNRTSRVNAYPL